MHENTVCHRQLSCTRKCSNRQDLALAADLDLALRKCRKIEPGARRGFLGNHELAGKVLGQAFEAARGIDGITDRGYRGNIAIAHLSDNVGPQ